MIAFGCSDARVFGVPFMDLGEVRRDVGLSRPCAHQVRQLPFGARLAGACPGVLLAAAACDPVRNSGGRADDFVRGTQEGIASMQHLHLAGAGNGMAPAIAVELCRAGRLRTFAVSRPCS